MGLSSNMNRNTWKEHERVISRYFGTERTALSGSNSKITQSDTLHKELFIEVKSRKKLPFGKLWEDTCKKANKENKLPLIALFQTSSQNPFIFCPLKDLKNIASYLILE